MGFMSNENSIGTRIRRLRVAAGLSQSALASALEARGVNIPSTTVYKIEQGKRNVLASELIPIANTLGVGVLDLLGMGSDRAPLVSAGARLEEAQRHLLDAATAYARAMLSYAQAADRSDSLHEADHAYASDALLAQTPAWIASTSVESIEATLKLNRVEVTSGFARLVLDALKRDYLHFHVMAELGAGRPYDPNDPDTWFEGVPDGIPGHRRIDPDSFSPEEE